MAWDERRVYNDHRGGRRSGAFSRSGWATAIVIALALLTFGVLWHAHQRARFHQLTTPVIPQTTSAPMPGGQEAILLSRVALVNDSEPEFVSATVLPGIGMQLLQATVAVPDQPAQDLLASVPLSDVAGMAPTSISSAPFHLRISTHHVQAGKSDAADDLVGFAPASNPQNQTLVDGGEASGTFQGTADRAGVSASIEVTLSGRQIDLVTRATNKSQQNRYVSFEWCPRFAAPDGNLNHLILSVPSRSAPGAGGDGQAAGVSSEHGQSVGDHPLDLHLTHLGREFLSDGTYVRLQNGDRFFLRVLGLGDTLRSVHARSDSATHTLLLSFSSLDPAAEPEQRDQILRAGQTIQWHLRLEVLPVKAAQAAEPLR